jgi:hypothetical protein
MMKIRILRLAIIQTDSEKQFAKMYIGAKVLFEKTPHFIARRVILVTCRAHQYFEEKTWNQLEQALILKSLKNPEIPAVT